MQPEQDNFTENNVNVPPPVPYPVEEQQPVYAQPQPQIQQQQQPQPVPVSEPVQAQYNQPAYVQPASYNSGGYFNTLKTLFTNPKAYFDNPPANILQSIIFPAINLGFMMLVLFMTTLISVLTINNEEGSSPFDKLTGEFWGQLFKSIGLSSLYIALFLAIIAGIIYVFALVAKRSAEYKDILSMNSIFSLNFLAVAVSAIVKLAFSWVDSADFSSVITMICGLLTSLVFVYAAVLIIQGISEVTQFNFFKSTAIFVVSSVLIVFIAGKIVTDIPANGDFGLSFGGYSNSVSKTSDVLDSLKTLRDLLNY